VVTFGGEDPQNLTLAALAALDEHVSRRLEVHVILGPLFRRRDEVRAMASASRHAATIHSFGDAIPRIMAGADLAFCGCGSTLMELAYLGRPVIPAAQNDREQSFLKYFERAGYALTNVGGALRSANPAALLRLLQDGALRRETAAMGPAIVDGHGAQRIVNIMREIWLV